MCSLVCQTSTNYQISNFLQANLLEDLMIYRPRTVKVWFWNLMWTYAHVLVRSHFRLLYFWVEQISTWKLQLDNTYHMVDSSHNLSKQQFDFRFWKPSLIGNLGEELSTIGILHDNVELGKSLNHLIETDDIGVVEALHAGDLTWQQPLGLLVKLGLIQDLYGHFLCHRHTVKSDLEKTVSYYALICGGNSKYSWKGSNINAVTPQHRDYKPQELKFNTVTESFLFSKIHTTRSLSAIVPDP